MASRSNVSGGPAAWVGDELARALAAVLRERGILANTLGGNRRSQSLSADGYRRDRADGPAELVIAFAHSDRSGKTLATYETRFAPPAVFWTRPTPELFRMVAEGIADRAFDWVMPAIVDSGAASLGPGLAITTIKGAAGEGDRLLRRALKRALDDRSVRAVPSSIATLFVLPDISVTAAADGLRRLRLRWIVIRLDGVEIGRIEQENTIGADDTLVETLHAAAREIADGAASGIAAVVRAYQGEQGEDRQSGSQ